MRRTLALLVLTSPLVLFSQQPSYAVFNPDPSLGPDTSLEDGFRHTSGGHHSGNIQGQVACTYTGPNAEGKKNIPCQTLCTSSVSRGFLTSVHLLGRGAHTLCCVDARMTQVQYTLEWLLPYVRRIQARGNIDYHLFAEWVWAQLEKAGIPGVCRTSQFNVASGRTFQYDALPSDLKNATAEAWFYLFRNGYTAPAPPDDYLQPPNLYKLHVTQRGIAWFDGKEPIPEDAHGYMAFLRGLVPMLEPVIEQYITESLIAFNREAYFAAAVMLGAASEKTIYVLADSLLDAIMDPKKREKLEALLKRRKLLDLLDAVGKLIHDAPNLPYEVTEGSEPHLISLFEAIRVQRNDAVHPMNAAVSVDSVRMMILGFPHALAKAEELRSWFIAHPKSI